jgi:hypothetical protein
MSNRNWDRVRIGDRVRRHGRERTADALGALFPHLPSGSAPARPAPLSKADLRAQAEAAFRERAPRKV